MMENRPMPDIVDINNHNPSHLRNSPNVKGMSVSSS